METREDFKRDMIVIHEESRRRGVIVEDLYGVCAPSEVPVLYDGEEGYHGTDWRELVLYDLN
jgi:hypothetical protein